MRKFLALTLLLATIPAAAQAPPTGWSRVQALAPGTTIAVKSRLHSTFNCKVVSSDGSSLTCAGTPQGVVQTTIARTDVLKITKHRRGLSALAGFGIGFGAGAGIGAGLGNGGITDSRGLRSVATGFTFGLVGIVVGALTDFLHSTIYKSNWTYLTKKGLEDCSPSPPVSGPPAGVQA